MHSTKKMVLSIIVAAIVFFGLGYWGAHFLPTEEVLKVSKKEPIKNNSFQAGWDAAKKRLEDIGFMPMIPGAEIKTVSGNVSRIKNNFIDLKIHPINPLDDPDLDNRTVEITEETVILQKIRKGDEEYQKEMEGFNQKMEEQLKAANEDPAAPIASPIMPIMPPEMYTEKEVSADNIKEGQLLTVTATEDVNSKKKFAASKILISENISPITVPPASVQKVAPPAENVPAPAPAALSEEIK